jgi:hypothetical protein
MESRGSLLSFALTNSMDKPTPVSQVSSVPEKPEEQNSHVEPFLNLLLPRDFLDLNISTGALNKMASFMHEFAVKLVEESVRAKEEDTKQELDERDVKKALIRLLACPIDSSPNLQGLYSSYFDKIDAKVKEFEFILQKRKEWKLWKEKRNVQVYQVVDSRPDAPLLMGRGKIDVSVDTMKNLIIEVSNWKQWDPLFDSGVIVETIDNHTKILYVKYVANVCLIKQARDFVLLSYWYQKKDGTFIGVATSCTHPKCPDNVPGCTRGEVFNSGYEIVPDVRIYLELICFSEKWLLFYFC